MSDTPAELKYTPTHEWARLESDDRVVVGITDFAQNALGDIVFLELPEVGSVVSAGDEVAVVESVKAASDIYSPIGGEIVECNEVLQDQPELVNEEPFADGWIFVVTPSSIDAMDDLMDAEEYLDHCESEEDH